MKRIIALLIATISLSIAAQAAQKSNSTLNYLDKAGYVCSIDIDANGKTVSAPQRLTAKGGYANYSVSPDNGMIFLAKQIGTEGGDFPIFKFLLEKNGKTLGTILSRRLADGIPYACWSPQSRYLIIKNPQQVEIGTIIYSLEKRKIVCITTDLLPDFCSDQDYSFVLQDNGDADNSASWLSMMDMNSGKRTKITQVNYGMDGDPSQNVWFGKTHKFAFINFKGDLGAGEVSYGKSGPNVKKWMLTKNGGCSDIRYITGKGIYFEKTGDDKKAFLSSDLKTLKTTALLPAKTDSVDGHVFSPNKQLLYDYPSSDELNMIIVRDKSGKSINVVKGTMPMWKGER